MSRLRLVILDVDGTLVDSQAIIVEAQRRTFSYARPRAADAGALALDRRAFASGGVPGAAGRGA